MYNLLTHHSIRIAKLFEKSKKMLAFLMGTEAILHLFYPQCLVYYMAFNRLSFDTVHFINKYIIDKKWKVIKIYISEYYRN